MNADGSQSGEPIKTVLVPSSEGELPIRDGLFTGDHRFFSTRLGR
jgi:hypothetical protein